MAKIQVQGIGMFTDDTLKKKIIQLANDLQKNAKKGNWNKASENGIRALGRMWGAYQDWSRQNESVNEQQKRQASDIQRKYDKAHLKFSREVRDVIQMINKYQGDKTDGRIIDKAFSKHLIPFNQVIQSWTDGQHRNPNLSESVLNERIKTPFMVHPSDPDQTERHWVKVFKELAKGHGHIIDYGPRESDIYDWNDRRNYKEAIQEYNKYMNKVADKLNKSLDEMNNIYNVWSKIRDKYRKKDKS